MRFRPFWKFETQFVFSAQAEQHEQDLPKGLRPGTLPGGGETEVGGETFVTKYLKDNFQKPD